MVDISKLGEPRALFSNQDLSILTDAYVREALQAVDKMPADQLLNTPTDDIVNQLVDKHSFNAPIIKADDAYIDGPQEIEIRRSDYGTDIRIKATLVALVVPIEGEASLLYMNPNRYGHSILGNLYHNNIVLTVQGQNLDSQRVDENLKSQLKEISEFLGWQREIADHHRQTLPLTLKPRIESRKARLLADRNMVSGLSFPIKERHNSPNTYVAPAVRKKVVVQRTPTTSPYRPEPVLDEANYNAILEIIHSMALVMERSPSAFKEMGEEHLRMQFLVPLNSHFEGAATGETFNYQGKTDILIRVDNRNIFIAECKYWSGEKAFLETIDQILGYLSWRDTKTAIILFSRNKNFTDVLAKVKEAARRHGHYKRGPNVESETRLRYVFGNPSDHHREVVVTVMAFDVPN